MGLAPPSFPWDQLIPKVRNTFSPKPYTSLLLPALSQSGKPLSGFLFGESRMPEQPRPAALG
jgi:hypothetical protein